MNRKTAQANRNETMKLAQTLRTQTNLTGGALLNAIAYTIRRTKNHIISSSKVSAIASIAVAIITSIVSLTVLLTINTTPTSAASSTANASINVASACTLTTTGTGTYSTTMNPGATKELTGSPLKVSCNDKNGYDLYAIGFSGDSYDTNNTDMLSSLGTSYNIKTNTSGSNSYWAMKVAGSGTNTPTIDNSYSNYKTIPTTYTKISHFTGTTINSITTPTYKVALSSDQAAGTYTGKVKYTIVHPSGSEAPSSIEMQNLDPSLCTSTPITVFDNRDNTNYRIARLADGKCWLLDNLALDLTNSTVLAEMNSTNTNASDTTLGYLKGITSRDQSTDPNGKYATAGASNWINGGSYSIPLVSMSSKEIIPIYNDAEDYYDSMKDDVVEGGWKVGGYYNYCSATAGSYCFGNDTSPGSGTGRATEDICPSGWRMPSGNTYGDYALLAQAIYGSTGNSSGDTAYINYRRALHLPLSGYYHTDGVAEIQGVNGFFWSSTDRGDTYQMYDLYVIYDQINPNDFRFRRNGQSVRCILKS